MATTNTIAIAAYRHEMADDALDEITLVAGALLHLIERHDVTGSVTKLSRGMLSRIKALSMIAGECLADDENDRRADDEIAHELTGHRVPAPAQVEASEGTGGDQLRGAEALFELLSELQRVPRDVLRPGMTQGEDDSTVQALHLAQDAVLRSLARCGFEVRERALAEGFAAGLASELVAALDGLSIDVPADPRAAAEATLADVEDARKGRLTEEPGQAANPSAPAALGAVDAAALARDQVAISQFDANDAPTATMVISPVQALELAEQLRAAAAVASRGAAVYRAEVRT